LLAKKMGITDGTRKAYEIQTISTWSALVTDEWYVFIQHFPMTFEDYHPDSFNSTVDPRVFVLSSYCQVGKKCSPFSYCRALDDDNK